MGVLQAADWAVYELAAVRVERIGVDGRPTGWRILRQGAVVGHADSEVNALLMGLSLAAHGTDEWIAMVKLAVEMVGERTRQPIRRAA